MNAIPVHWININKNLSDDERWWWKLYMRFFKRIQQYRLSLAWERYPPDTICVCVFVVGNAEPSTSTDMRRKANRNICVILYTNQIHLFPSMATMRRWSLSLYIYVHEWICNRSQSPAWNYYYFFSIATIQFSPPPSTNNSHHIRRIVHFTPSMGIMHGVCARFFHWLFQFDRAQWN